MAFLAQQSWQGCSTEEVNGVTKGCLTAGLKAAGFPSIPLRSYQADQDVPLLEVEWHEQEALWVVAQLEWEE